MVYLFKVRITMFKVNKNNRTISLTLWDYSSQVAEIPTVKYIIQVKNDKQMAVQNIKTWIADCVQS